MTTVVLCVVLAAVVVAAFSTPARTMVGGMLQRDRKGRLTLILTPTPRRRGRRKKKK